MNELRKGLPPVPPRMATLPIDSRGYPIPWFVATLSDGSRDFRVADGAKADKARRFGNCWVCGDVVGRIHTFVIGPMCAVNRTTSEPGCHRECAEFSVMACPFLTLPRAKRNEAGLPEGSRKSLGPEEFAIPRNPGVSCLWTTNGFRLWRLPDGVLYRLGDPVSVTWWAEKRPATREEVLHSIDTGMPLLEKYAAQESPRALQALRAAYGRMLAYLPEAA